jgi:hypothetical protein
MNMEMILGLVRHILTFGGGLLVTKGYLDEATAQQAVGAVITLGGIVWSALAKKKAE